MAHNLRASKSPMYVRPNVTIGEFKESIKGIAQDIFPVVDVNGRYRGFIRRDDLYERSGQDDMTAEELLDECDKLERRDVYIYEDTDVIQARKVLDANRINFVPIVDPTGYYLGTLDRSST